VKLARNLKAWAAARVVAHAIRKTPGGEGTLMNFLSGYKTYLTAAAAVISVLIGLANGTIDMAQAIEALSAAGLFVTLRHAVASKASGVISFLGGYKTYLVAAGSVIAAASAYASGNAGLVDAAQVVITAVMGVFLRKGLNTVQA